MGQHLAQTEMRLNLSKMIYTFNVEAVEGKQCRLEHPKTLLLVEKWPIYVRLKPRSMWSEVR
jgi:hypothetical protein